jgi:biopolymer transport protein ExbD
VIDVDRAGNYSILGERMSLDALATRIGAAQGSTGTRHSGIVVRADRAAGAAALNRLAERLAKAKIANWSLAVAPEGS